MNVLFEVIAETPTMVDFNGETFEVFGHVQIIELDETTQTWVPVEP